MDQAFIKNRYIFFVLLNISVVCDLSSFWANMHKCNWSVALITFHVEECGPVLSVYCELFEFPVHN